MMSTVQKKDSDQHHSIVPSTRDMFRGFDDWFSRDPFFSAPSILPSLFPDVDRRTDTVLRRSSPFYEVTEDEKRFQLAVDVPGVKAQDMNVQLEHGGRVLRLWGGRKVVRGDATSETKFEKSFTIDRSVDTEKITANLADGVLVVTAPKNPQNVDIKKIPITQGPAPSLLKE